MLYDRIDHVILPVASLDDAASAYQRLGLTLTPRGRHRDRGTHNRVFFVGDEASEFYVELLGVADEDEARHARGEGFLEMVAAGRGLSTVMLRTDDLPAVLAGPAGHGLNPAPVEVYAEDGRKICDVAELGDEAKARVHTRVVRYPEGAADRFARHAAAGFLTHAFPLKRLDHLAAVAPDLDATTRYWADVLGVPVAGEIATPALIIRQLKIGDAILELLGPATPDSPMAKRPPGLVSMAAFEVENLDAAVTAARAAGFTVPDPATGVLPRTRTATIPAGELAGMAMQLLEYV